MTPSEELDLALEEINTYFRSSIAERGRVGVWHNHVPYEAEKAISRLFEAGVRTLHNRPSNRWTDGATILRMLSTADGDVELRAVLWWGPSDDVGEGLTPEYIHGWFRLYSDGLQIRDCAFRIGEGNNSLLFTAAPPN